MSSDNTISISQPERPLGEIPFLHMPNRHWVFRERAARLRKLAAAHPMKESLEFVASICDAQHAALQIFPNVPLPKEAQLKLCREHGMPPLSAQGWQRDLSWQDALWHISVLVRSDINPAGLSVLSTLQKMDSDALESQAEAILGSSGQGIDVAIAPFVVAALQVYWTHMATALGASAFARSDVGNLCPVCGSHPVSSVVRIGGAEQGVRYLNCSLCETQWHMVRVKCSNCESTKGISYFAIEGDPGAVKAEACEECGSYLKIMYMEKDPQVDPVADDLSSLALDLLLDDSGMQRSGPNLFCLSATEPAV